MVGALIRLAEDATDHELAEEQLNRMKKWFRGSSDAEEAAMHLARTIALHRPADLREALTNEAEALRALADLMPFAGEGDLFLATVRRHLLRLMGLT